jgi:hypothetical protein
MTMRDDVRTAFARQLSALGDTGDARHRLMHEAMLNRDRAQTPGWQWAAGIAAILIAAIVIVTFALVKVNTHTTVVPAATPSPRAQASPTPLVNELNVPDSTPIIVYHDPANVDQVDGTTWDGRQSGKITGGSLAMANPANNLFGQGGQIVDRHGNVVATGTYGAKFWEATWADDERHFCFMSPFDNAGAAGIPTTLMLSAPGEPPKAIAQVGTLYNQTTVTVLTCSVLGDRAVVVQSAGQGIGIAQYWVIQLSTGKVLWSRANPAAPRLVASRDGTYVAEDVTAGQTVGSTVFGPGGKPLAVDSEAVDAFSWDGSLAVVDMGAGVGTPRLIDWRNGNLVWAAPYHYNLLAVQPEPGGGSMAIWVAPSAGLSPQSQPPSLYIVAASGLVVVHIAGAGPSS